MLSINKINLVALVVTSALSTSATEMVFSGVELGKTLPVRHIQDVGYPSGIDRFLLGHELPANTVPFKIDKMHAFVTPKSQQVLMITMRAKINIDSCDSYDRIFEKYVSENFPNYSGTDIEGVELIGSKDGIKYLYDYKQGGVASYGCVGGEQNYFTASFQDTTLWDLFDEERDFVATSLDSNKNKE